MESAEIARRFLTYFSERGHTVVPSASLIADDPTLLLVNAGMQPFKPYFLGQVEPPFKRATSCQKCVRTPDIEEVGKTTRHGTFFQMLGNFSFGDYFKDQAIPFAWELLTTPERDGGFGFAEDRLWATVYHDDDEAARIWRDVVGVPESRIQRRGMADNYWSMGVPGPCGPCSEIYYDRGPDYGREGGPVADEERYLEVWNLVFMQYLRGEGAGKEGWPILGELPSRNIDTGMGLERMAAILQGVDNIYEVDTLWKVLDRAAELTEQKYGRDHRVDVALRVVADHVRTAAMLVADGVLPSNEGRGYVLRRILRRSVYNLRLLAGGQRGGGSDGRYLHELAGTALGAMADLYPELVEATPRVLGVIDAEESTFLSTLRTGSAIFDAAVGESKRRGAAALSGEQAFQLHDTYGFPIDLTLEMASEQGLQVDEEGFRRLMAEQRQRAKAGLPGEEDRERGHLRVRRPAGQVRAGRLHRVRRDLRRGHGHRAAGRRGERPRGGRGHRGRGHPGPDPVLRPGRRPARGQRGDPGGQRPRRGRRRGGGPRRADPRARADRAPGRGHLRGSGGRRGRRGGASTPSAAGPSPARTPPPTWCTARSAAPSATPRPRPGRRTRPAASASTSPPREPSRRPCCATWRTRSTRSSSTTSRSGRSSRPSTRRAPWARSPCSGRSTATRSAWSRSATTPANCAGAPTWPTPASSG